MVDLIRNPGLRGLRGLPTRRRLLTGLTPESSRWRPITGAVQIKRGHYLLYLGPVEVEEPPRFVVLGWESLQRLVGFVVGLAPFVLIMDELHKCKSRHRWVAVQGANPDGTDAVSFRQRDNMATAALRLARATPWRIAASATPIRDRVRDLWAQLDLLRPGEWGNWRSWTGRYAGGCESQYTRWDTSSSSNEEELAGRLSFLMHVVPREVSTSLAFDRSGIEALVDGHPETRRIRTFLADGHHVSRVVKQVARALAA